MLRIVMYLLHSLWNFVKSKYQSFQKKFQQKSGNFKIEKLLQMKNKQNIFHQNEIGNYLKFLPLRRTHRKFSVSLTLAQLYYPKQL